MLRHAWLSLSPVDTCTVNHFHVADAASVVADAGKVTVEGAVSLDELSVGDKVVSCGAASSSKVGSKVKVVECSADAKMTNAQKMRRGRRS